MEQRNGTIYREHILIMQDVFDLRIRARRRVYMLQCAAVCCSVLQLGALYCSAEQYTEHILI